MRISERLLTVLVLCLLAAAIPGYAKGNGEREYKSAQALVEAKQYTQALTLLVRILKEFPEQREAADALVDRVMVARDRFNGLYDELVEVINTKPNPDVKRGEDLLGRLMELDPNHDFATEERLTVARVLLLAAEKERLFQSVMNKAAKQIADRKLADAVATYLDEGFPVARDEFMRAAYPAQLVDQAVSTVGDLADTARQAAPPPDLSALPAALEALLAAPVSDAARTEFLELLQPLVQARQLEARIRGLAVSVRAVNAEIADATGADQPMEARNWPSFVEEYALGRPEKTKNTEGLAYVARQPWITIARQLSDTVSEAADGTSREMAKAFEADDLPTNYRVFTDNVRSMGRLALEVIETEMPAYREGDGIALNTDDIARSAALATRAAAIRQNMRVADAWDDHVVAESMARSTLTELEGSLASVPISPSGTDTESLRRGRTTFATIRQTAQSGAEAWAVRVAEAATTVISSRAAAIRDRFGDLVARTNARDADYAIHLAALEARDFEPRRAAAAERYEEGRDLAAGTRGGLAVQAGRHPELAGVEYTHAITGVGTLLSDIDAWLERWNAERDRGVSSTDITRLLAEQEGLRGRVVELRTAIETDLEAARAAVARAEELRRLGEVSYTTGNAHNRNSRYAEAVSEYQTASARYGESLDLQENREARDRVNELSVLILEMRNKSNADILAKISALIDDGKALSGRGKYTEAVAALEEAKRLWESVNPTEPNEILEYNLGMALRGKRESGRREITRTDPIYQDVRGFMTQAELSYSEAVKLKRTAPSSDRYRESIATARASVEAITTAVSEYLPARLMDLKIERLEKGDVAFKASLLQRIQDALARANDPRATDVTMRGTRLSLMDYKEIEGYTGIVPKATRDQIDKAVVALEERLGMRAPEPDERLVRESRALYDQANTRYRAHRNDETYWDYVLNLLKESTKKWPGNTAANTLYWEIARKRGSVESLLSMEEEAQWRVAINAYSAKDYPQAKFLVAQLLARKPNQPGLLRLKSLIDLAQGRGQGS